VLPYNYVPVVKRELFIEELILLADVWSEVGCDCLVALAGVAHVPSSLIPLSVTGFLFRI